MTWLNKTKKQRILQTNLKPDYFWTSNIFWISSAYLAVLKEFYVCISRYIKAKASSLCTSCLRTSPHTYNRYRCTRIIHCLILLWLGLPTLNKYYKIYTPDCRHLVELVRIHSWYGETGQGLSGLNSRISTNEFNSRSYIW